MRMSCNGCRVLRKGCSENCSIRPCLQWIKSPESQANATVFLAKFFGRAGLINLLNSGPQHLRPAIFRSLLYEACGRILNPIFGSVGLLWSGSWQLCQEAVEAVLKGDPITPMTAEAAATDHGPLLKGYDIRHVYNKDENSAETSDSPHRVIKTRCRVKKDKKAAAIVEDSDPAFYADELSQQSDAPNVENESKELSESMISTETTSSGLFRPEPVLKLVEESGLALELTLGLEPVSCDHHATPMKKRRIQTSTSNENGSCKMELSLDLRACGQSQ